MPIREYWVLNNIEPCVTERTECNCDKPCGRIHRVVAEDNRYYKKGLRIISPKGFTHRL